MTKKEKWQLVFVAIVLVVIGVLCFFLGRSTIKVPAEKIKIEYVQGPTIRDTIKYPQPYIVERPIDTVDIIRQCIRDGIYTELFPTKTITEYIEVTREDTTGILEDWATKRHYSETIFDSDTLGKCVINTEVQYNRMRMLGYSYTPVYKVVTETNYIVKKFSPFVGIGGMINPFDKEILPTCGLNAGFFIKEHYGFQLQYQYEFKYRNNFIGGNIMYKF